MSDLKDIWKKVLQHASERLKKSYILTWYKDTALLSLEGKKATIGVPSVFLRDWHQNKNHDVSLDLLRKECPELEEIDYVIDSTLSYADDMRKIDIKKLYIEKPELEDKKHRKIRNKMEVRLIEGITSKLLNPKYTLANFVVGPENRLAHAACSAVAEDPGGAYNPLFVYGGVGLGKTHLLQAIGNEILANSPDALVVYVPSERFINEIVDAIGKRHTNEFRSKYRRVDCLMVDDVQFFAHKEQTQVEFFHTFNDLFEANKQIIVSSDRPPKELTQLHDRLRSRFEMGMTVDVQFPGYETRMAILQQKCREHHSLISSEVLEFIAYNVRDSIRELEGILLQAIAQAKLEGRVPTLKSVADMMAKLDKKLHDSGISEVSGNLNQARTFDEVLDIVSAYYRVPRSELIGECRKKEVIVPRQVTMFLVRNELNFSYERIGSDFGGKNHTTVMHACEKIKKQLQEDAKLVNDINFIKKEMGL